jgi:hypothetical protein
MEMNYRNKNCGYQQIRAWQDAIDLYESVSGFHAYRMAEQITEADYNALNDLSFKLENGLLKLVESFERKQETGDWIDSLIIKESNLAYG